MNYSDWLKSLKVGDKVIVSSSSPITRPHVDKVKRLTKTMIVLEGIRTRFNRARGMPTGDYSYYGCHLYEPTEEALKDIRDRAARDAALNEITNVDWRKASTEKIQAILKILKD